MTAPTSKLLSLALTFAISGVSCLGFEIAEENKSGFEEASRLFEQELDADRLALAYDYLLVASRLDSTQPALLDMVEKFADRASKSSDDRVQSLVESLLDRADSLVHFQKPSAVASARKRIDGLRKQLDELGDVPADDAGIDDDLVVRYLRVAENSYIPIATRSAAAEQARQLIDAELLNEAIDSPEQEFTASDRIKSLLKRTERAEQACLLTLYRDWEARYNAWKTEVEGIETLASDMPSKYPEQAAFQSGVSRKARHLIDSGFTLMQELLPYSRAQVPGSFGAESALAEHLNMLRRLRAWYRNQSVLSTIKEVEDEWRSDSYETSLTKLAAAWEDEELMIPYVAERLSSKWNEAFSGLEKKRPKNAPEMLKLRFLGPLLPQGGVR